MKPNKKDIQKYYLGTKTELADKILLIKRNRRINEYKEYFSEITEFGNVWNGFTGILNGEKISIIVSGIGPSSAGDCVYAINKKDASIVYTGTAASLKENIQIGDYVISNSYVCFDGYSQILGFKKKELVHENDTLFNKVKKAFESSKLDYKTGVCFTTASCVIESENQFWKNVNSESDIIEMEGASIASSGIKRGNNISTYFWITDKPLHKKSFFDVLSPEEIDLKHKIYQKNVEVDIKIISKI